MIMMVMAMAMMITECDAFLVVNERESEREKVGLYMAVEVLNPVQ